MPGVKYRFVHFVNKYPKYAFGQLWCGKHKIDFVTKDVNRTDMHHASTIKVCPVCILIWSLEIKYAMKQRQQELGYLNMINLEEGRKHRWKKNVG